MSYEVEIYSLALTLNEINAIYNLCGARAPEFAFILFQREQSLIVRNSTIELSDLRGKPQILNFWAGRMPPSRSEILEFQDFHEEIGGQINLVGLDAGPFTLLGSNQDARNLLGELGITYAAGFTSDERLLNF